MEMPLRAHESRAELDELYVRGMERLIEVVQDLSLARDMPTLQGIVRTAARELTRADGATFVLREGDNCFYADEDAIAPLWKGLRFPMETCISGWVMQHRLPAVIPDIYKDERIPVAAYQPTFVKSLVMVPIRRQDPIGAIGNYWARRHLPTARELQLLRALADSTAVAMESISIVSDLEQHVRRRTSDLEAANAEIRQLSLADELTGLHNRRGFFILAEQIRKAAARLSKSVFLLFIDADGLKKVNDSLGHEAGDAMLRDIADVLRATFRKSDVVARLGGDEYCVFGMHDGQDPGTAKRRLETAIAEFNAASTRPYRLAASSGVFSFDAGEAYSLEDVVTRADKSMYEEKRERKRLAAGAA